MAWIFVHFQTFSNLFQTNNRFLYLEKTLQNPWFSDLFRGYGMRTVVVTKGQTYLNKPTTFSCRFVLVRLAFFNKKSQNVLLFTPESYFKGLNEKQVFDLVGLSSKAQFRIG